MAPSAEQPDDQLSLLQKAAEEHVSQILDRRRAAQESRAAALARLPDPLTLDIRLVRNAEPEDSAAPVAPFRSATIQTAGYLLAIGDSWFNYPIRDVLTNLHDHFGYNIESAAHRGDAIETMVSHVGQLDHFSRNLDKVISLGVTPKAVLLSGGGNDIAGSHFDLFLNNVDLKLDALNEQVVAGVIDTRLATAYRLMFLSINTLCQERLKKIVPILIHGYDQPVPDGRGFLGGWGPLPGPWLKPGFDEKLYLKIRDNTVLMTTLIDRFNAMLQRVALEPSAGNVRYVDSAARSQQHLRITSCSGPTNFTRPADPIDPGRNGFLLVAERFAVVLAQLP